MNKLIIKFFILILIGAAGCNSNRDGYIINGKITGDGECLKKGIIYMKLADTKGMIYDSALVKNGRFELRGKLNSPERMLLYIKDLPYNIPLCLENDNYRIEAESASLRDAKISGGESQELFNMLNNKSKYVMNKYKLNDILSEVFNPGTDSLRKYELNLILKSANNEMGRFNDSLIKTNPSSFYSLLNLFEIANDAEFNKVTERLKYFEDNNLFRGNRYYSLIKEIIAKRENLLEGKTAPDFTLESIDNVLLSLKELTSKNRFTILLFWASWNKESIEMCRRYLSFYKKGNFKEIEIVAVSVNDISSNWRKSVQRENFNWINLIDNNKKEVMLNYNIKLIPKAFLIDKDNRIVMNDFKPDSIKQIINTGF